MKACIKNLLLLQLLAATLGSVLVGQVSAQTFKVLHSFEYGEGEVPTSDLVLSGTTLYGTTSLGDADLTWNGSLYSVRTDGSGFTNLHTFIPRPDGFDAVAGLLASGNKLYGTASLGGLGNSDSGTIFQLSADGSDFKVLYGFSPFVFPANNNSDGAMPYRLVLSGNALYGNTQQGGGPDYGTLFKLNSDGTGFTVLHTFTGGTDGGGPVGLILCSNKLYGTTGYGVENGTIFSVGTDGTGFTVLHSFTGGGDGAGPIDLVLSDNTLYATASYGGTFSNGTVFAVNIDGGDFKTLHNFAMGGTNTAGVFTNSDGTLPATGLILSGQALYGATSSGGSWGGGTVFSVNADGSGFQTLHAFSALSTPYNTNSDGAGPVALILSGNTLYGATGNGGPYSGIFGHHSYTSFGTVFSISLLPQPTLTRSESNIILTWPTNFTGFTLQSTTNLGSPVWTTNSPAPVVVNGQNTVTNPISGTQQFFRLSK